MNVKQLTKILSKLPPDTKIMVVNEYDRTISLKISAEMFEHDGFECGGFHPERKWKSNIPTDNYFFITAKED